MIGEDLEMSDYLAHQALGSTAIRIAATQSVAHYLAKEEKPPTVAQALGTIAHCAVLEPEKFLERYIQATERQCAATTKRGTQCSFQAVPGVTKCSRHGGAEELEEWARANPGKVIVEPNAYEAVSDIAQGLERGLKRTYGADGKSLSWMLERAQTERSLFCFARETDNGYELDPTTAKYAGAASRRGELIVRARVDAIIAENCLALDLKGSSRGIDPRRWSYQIRDYGLHIQAALYCEILRAFTGDDWAWGWIAHESTRPYAVRVYEAARADLDEGWKLVERGLRRWSMFIEEGTEWAGWPCSIDVCAAFGGGYGESEE